MKVYTTFESFKENICAADALRMDLIEEFFKEIEDDDEYNIDEPDYDSLLDKWDGYEFQTYIQNDLDNNQIIYWEGWVKECWDALYNKKEYQKLSKTEAISKIIKERFPKIANEFNLKISDYQLFWYESDMEGIEDGYIMKIIFQKN